MRLFNQSFSSFVRRLRKREEENMKKDIYESDNGGK